MITGQEYTWADAGLAALIGAICGIPNWGPWVGGVLSGIVTGVSNYKDGASLGGAIISGVIDGVIVVGSIGQLASLSGVDSDIATEIVVDAVFGTGGNALSSAISESTVITGNINNSTPKNTVASNSYTTDSLNRIKEVSQTRIIYGEIIKIGKHMCYVDKDDYNKIYCKVTLQ